LPVCKGDPQGLHELAVAEGKYQCVGIKLLYLEAVRQFSAFCSGICIVDLAQVEPIHVRPLSKTSSGSAPSPR